MVVIGNPRVPGRKRYRNTGKTFRIGQSDRRQEINF